MESLKLGPIIKDDPCQVVHYVKIVVKAKGFEELDVEPRTNDDNMIKPIEETYTFQLNIKEEYVTQLGNQVLGEDKSNLQQVIRTHADPFAQSAADLSRIDPIFHC